MIPIAGSAYTYAYVTLGELLAWIIGWDLILEYAVGNVAVAVSWSGYFQSFLGGLRRAPAGVAVHRRSTRRAPRRASSRTRRTSSASPSSSTCRRSPSSRCSPCSSSSASRSRRAFNAVIVALKLVARRRLRRRRRLLGQPGELAPVRAERLHGHPDRRRRSSSSRTSASTPSRRRPRRRRTRSATCRIGMIASLVICTVLYVAVTAVLTGMVPCERARRRAIRWRWRCRRRAS